MKSVVQCCKSHAWRLPHSQQLSCQAIITDIKQIVDNGYGYQSGGDINFDITKLREYGLLSGRKQVSRFPGGKLMACCCPRALYQRIESKHRQQLQLVATVLYYALQSTDKAQHWLLWIDNLFAVRMTIGQGSVWLWMPVNAAQATLCFGRQESQGSRSGTAPGAPVALAGTSSAAP